MSSVSSVVANFCIFFFVICTFDSSKVHSMDDFSSGEFYYNNFVPLHSSEVDEKYGRGGYVLTSRKSRPNHIHCFQVQHENDADGENIYRDWPILNKFKKIKPAPPAPKLDDFDSYYGPQPITSAPFLDDYFDDGYTSAFNDGDEDTDGEKKEKVPFEICFMDCPAPNEGKQVCGDDGKTYDNIHKLNCAVRCGLRK